MIKHIKLRLRPEQAFHEQKRKQFIQRQLSLSEDDQFFEIPLKRSIDARGRKVWIQYETEVYINETPPEQELTEFKPQNVINAPEVLIAGCGPAGLFAALNLIEKGYKPIIIERGKDVRARRRDLAAINKEHKVNPDSNYCFGEGGAGTYSDGKLYTRSKKRGDVQRVLRLLVEHGATEDILVDAHPHIGTNKLPKVVAALRERIIECGGEIRFNSRITDFIIGDGQLKGVEIAGGEKVLADALILATGHSARDIYERLAQLEVLIEAKPFAMGLRMEHPQSLIDEIQYNRKDREPLPAASYSLVHQSHFQDKQRGVFSFCMCPGGFIVPAATDQEEIVVNGMSPSKRNSYHANSGLVVAIELEDLAAYSTKGALAGLSYQRALERSAWVVAGKSQSAPAQRLVDFCDDKHSNTLNSCSYVPGLESVDLKFVMGDELSNRIRGALKSFGKKMPGFYTNEANLVGVESRSSAPVRIPRDKESLEHPGLKNLFPCGEGAGYAGGIVSAAIDGEKVAISVARNLKSRNVRPVL